MKKRIFWILLAVVVCCIFYGIRYTGSSEKTQLAVLETYENVVDADGYVIKSEQVYASPASGIIYNYVQEGARIKKNSTLSAIYTDQSAEETLSEIDSIGKKIEELEGAGKASYSLSSSTGDNIENIKNNIINAQNSKDVSKVATYKMQLKSVVTGDVQDLQGGNLEELKEKRKKLESNLQSCKNYIFAQAAGFFSKNIDGLEGTLTIQNVENYTAKDYDAIPAVNIEEKTAVAAGEPVCKIISNTWYVMSKISADAAAEMKLDQKVKLRFLNLPGIEAEGKIYKISNENSGTKENVVLIKFEQYKEGILSIRYSPVEIVLESYEGFCVPVSAIHIKNGKKGVMVKTNGASNFKECTVIYADTDTQTVIVKPVYKASSKPLAENDVIVIGEK